MKYKEKKYSRLISYINERLNVIKIQVGLMKEYERGIFYSIPVGIFDKTDEASKEYLNRFRMLFEENENIYQTVPRFLYDLKNPKENERFFEILRRKIEKGIYLDCYPITMGYDFSEEDLVKFLELRELNEKNELEVELRLLNDKNVSNAIGNCAFEMSYGAKAHIIQKRIKEGIPIDGEPVCTVKIAYRKDGKKPETVEEIRDAIELYDVIHKSYNAAELSLLINQSNWSPKERSGVYDKLISAWETTYSEEYKNIDNWGREKVIGDFREFFKTKFYVYSVEDSQNLESDDEARNRKEEQRTFLFGVIDRISKIGSLNDLINAENQNVLAWNLFFKTKNVFPKVSMESLIESIENLNLDSVNGGLKLDILLLHFIGVFKELYQDFTYASIEMGTYGIDRIKDVNEEVKDVYRKKLHELAEVYVNNPGDEEAYRRLETFLRLIKPTNSTTFISATINKNNPKMHKSIDALVDREKNADMYFNKISDFSKELYQKIENFYNEYQKLVENGKKNNINPPTFEEYFREILKIYNIEKNKIKYQRTCNMTFKGKYEDKFPKFDDSAFKSFVDGIKAGKGELPFVGNDGESKLTLRILDFIRFEEKMMISSDIQNTLINLIRDIETKNRLDKVQDFYFKSILGVYRKNPDLVNLRNQKNDKESYVEIVLPKTLQIFKYPYSENDLSEEDRLAIETIPVAKKTDFVPESSSYSLFKTNIPQIEEMNNTQTNHMVELLNTLIFIETKSRRKIPKSDLVKLHELFKSSDKKYYRALKLRGCIAKGLGKYIREHTELEDKYDKLSDEERDLAESMIRIQTKARITPERFFSKYFRINASQIKECCLKKYRQKAYSDEEKAYAVTVEDAIIDDKLPDSMTYYGAIQEKEKISRNFLRKSGNKERADK